MAQSDRLVWSSASATVNVGETIVVPASYGMAPTSAGIEQYLNGHATVVINGSGVEFTGVSAGTSTIPAGSPVGAYSSTENAFTLTVTAPADDESYLNKRGLTHFWENIDSLKQDTLTAGTNISINNGTISSSQPAATTSSLGVVQVGSGLAISSGGVLSATGGGVADSVAWGHITGTLADQSDLNTALGSKANTADLATVATSGSYNDLTNKPTIPTVNNATLTIQKNSTTIDTFTANASQNKTIDITVPVTAADVSALPASTKYGASFTASINTTTYVMTLTLKDQDGNTLGTAQTIDLPLESVVVNGSYDSTNKKIVLTLQGGSTIDIPVGDLVAGLQSEITSTNKLDSDLVDDTGQTNKFMTSAEKTKLSGIAAGAEVNVQSDWNQTTTTADDYIKNKPQLAAVATSGAYSDLSGTPSLATVATSGSYNDLSNKPTIPAAQVNSDWNSTSGVSEILNKPTLSTVATTGAYGDLTGTPNLATVATSGSYNDLSNKPTIPTVNNATLTIQKNGTNVQTFTANQSTNATANITVPTKTSDLTNDSNFVESGDLATVATSGSYNDLSNKPTIPAAQVNSDWNASSGVAQILNKPTLATVATSGSYNDLSNKPTIPAAQVQSNWTQTTTTAVDYIKNKPTLATVATSGSYNDLSNKPTIPTVNNATLTIQKNGANVQTFTANQSTNATANITVPTKTSDLTNDSDFVTSSGTVAKANQLTTARTISISGGVTGTATSFSGAADISIPVTYVRDAYTIWGGKDLVSDISPDDAGCIDEFGHNKLAFLPAECIEVKYSTDGGTTWTDYGLTDAQKVAMVTTTGPGVGAGKSATITADNIANMRGRVRIACGTMAKSGKIYTALKKILINFSTNGATNTKIKMRRRTIANYLSGTETWEDLGTHNIGGWSGWNSYAYSGNFGGNMTSQTGQPGQIEFEFWGETFNSSYGSRCSLVDIRFIGTTNWTTPSELARAGHLYTMDTSQNATFPANVNVTGSLGHGSYTYTLPNKNGTVAMTSDVKTYTAGTGINIDANNVISATAVANTFASYSNGTLYITNNAQNADTESY